MYNIIIIISVTYNNNYNIIQRHVEYLRNRFGLFIDVRFDDWNFVGKRNEISMDDFRNAEQILTLIRTLLNRNNSVPVKLNRGCTKESNFR